MKKILLYTLMTVAAAGMTACEDFLTRDTYDQIGSDEFWKSETDLELYANGFIQKMIPGDGTITRGDIDADYCAVDIATDLLRPDGNVSPDNQGGWTESSWTNLRRVNYMLDNMHRCRGRVSDEVYNHYEGVARFWRAWFYYDKVRTFGAVPWYDFTISASDKEALTKPRDSREYVMDKVLEDLTFASTYCLADAKYTKGSALINKWVALAFKSRVCLYEGTFRKYHSREPSSDKPWQNDVYNADNKFLREAAAAAKEIMDKGPFSLVTGDVKTAYRSLFTSAGLLTQEVIFGREYSKELSAFHETSWYYYSPTYGTKIAMTKKFMNTYLTTKGTPFTDIDGYKTIDFIHDFVLKPLAAPETDFTLLCIADPQCASTADISRYVNETIPDIEATVETFKAKGRAVYGITLGDIVFDTPDLWSNMKEAMANRNLTIFQTIGNHDHLKTETSDDKAAANFESQFGPRNYSFNRGNAHIVSMDNVFYVGGSTPSSNYKGGITDQQLEWLRQDLSHVAKDKLVIFCAHMPFRGGTSETDESHMNHAGVLDLLSEFAEAHIMIGHTHYQQKYIHTRNGKKIFEHIHGAACGAWWTSTLCADGTPNGYGVYEISGSTVPNQYYKATNKAADHQIRAYSAKQVFGTSGSTTFGFAANASAMNDAKCIVANVWNSDTGGDWKVSLWQNGAKVGDMTRISTCDYWAYAYHVLYFSKSVGSTWGKKLDHFYYGRLTSGTPETADFEIVVEDGMGNTYRTSKLQTDFIGF